MRFSDAGKDMTCRRRMLSSSVSLLVLLLFHRSALLFDFYSPIPVNSPHMEKPFTGFSYVDTRRTLSCTGFLCPMRNKISGDKSYVSMFYPSLLKSLMPPQTSTPSISVDLHPNLSLMSKDVAMLKVSSVSGAPCCLGASWSLDLGQDLCKWAQMTFLGWIRPIFFSTWALN